MSITNRPPDMWTLVYWEEVEEKMMVEQYTELEDLAAAIVDKNLEQDALRVVNGFPVDISLNKCTEVKLSEEVSVVVAHE